LPPVGALDQLRGDEGILGRARSNPRLVIAIAAAAILTLAWIGWAIYVTSSNGATAGLGVVIAWPAMLAALALISLPFIGVYLLVKRLSPSDGEAEDATAEADEDEEGEGPETPAEEEGGDSDGDNETEEDEDDEDEDEDGDEEDGDDEDEAEDDGDSETEAETAKS
jgi:hypothetical protein